jgi:DNA-binding NarL/FixJ family response regulator
VESYVVEPQSLFVPYLVDVLGRAEMRVVRVAGTLDVDDIGRAHPEALFVDTDFLDGDPAEALSALRAVLPRALICAYTDGTGPARADRLRLAGADCVLSKRSGQYEITEGVRVARETGGYTDPRLVLAAEPPVPRTDEPRVAGRRRAGPRARTAG